MTLVGVNKPSQMPTFKELYNNSNNSVAMVTTKRKVIQENKQITGR